jgi:hypothetical protein
MYRAALAAAAWPSMPAKKIEGKPRVREALYRWLRSQGLSDDVLGIEG